MKYIVTQEKSAVFMYVHTGSHVQFIPFVLVVFVNHLHTRWVISPSSLTVLNCVALPVSR